MNTPSTSHHAQEEVTAVRRYFYTPLARQADAGEIRRWWDARRLLFNGIVGGAVLVSIGASVFFAGLPPSAPRISVPWVAAIWLAVVANLLYYLGPAADLTVRHYYGERAYVAGPVLLRYLFGFSVGLALLPVPLVALGWLARAVL